MARLSVEINSEEQTFASPIAVCRSAARSRTISSSTTRSSPRRHAEVELRGREAWVNDLGSRNGISVNRLRVKEVRLNDGDVIQVGPFEIRFEDRAAQSVLLDDSKYYPLAAEARDVTSGELPELALDLRDFFQISRRLNAIVGLRELLDAVMEEVLRVVPAQRGILMLLKGAELVPMVIYPPTQGDAISSTIVRRALDGHEAVLTRDARIDFGGSQSIISANIRSAICVPLLSEGRAIGIINVDSPGRDQFGERERDLLAAVANQAALNIERARLTDQLRAQEQQRQLFERFLSPNVAHDVASYFPSTAACASRRRAW